MRESGEQLESALSDLFQSHDENVGLAMDAQTDQITGAISDIRIELEHLGQGLNLGFEFMGRKLDRQIELGQEISSRLASIHNTLLTPAQTSAREFLQIAENHLRHRLFAEAMDFLGRSEQIETVNPSLHVFKGNVYFAQPEFLDLNAARKEFEIAIKYADALKEDLPFDVWWQVRDQGYLGLAKVAFVSSGDEHLAGNIEFADSLMKEALNSGFSAAVLVRDNLSSRYCCSALWITGLGLNNNPRHLRSSSALSGQCAMRSPLSSSASRTEENS